MDDNLNSVKTSPGDRRGYHHGALRSALLESAEQVIAERGVDGFSLREVARRAGVSPAAPAHHFRDTRGLLTALAAEAMRQFGDALEVADRAKTREARIRGQGIAYVRFALANRAGFDLMWRYTLIDRDDPDYVAASRRAFALLEGAVRGGEPPARGPTDPANATSVAAWSIVHGFASLWITGALPASLGSDAGAAARPVAGVLTLSPRGTGRDPGQETDDEPAAARP